MKRRGGLIGLAGCAALALAAPAAADVKAGVEAWGRGDYATAVREWQGPAAKGDADALFNLAQAYRLGRGVPEDLRQAEALYARAAAQGHIKAADNYGLLLFQDGRRQEAMPYVSAAAERGDPRAQYLLGIAHFNGDLVAKDWVRAYALLTLSNAAGLPQAAPAIQQMDAFIPLAQRQQAQSLAAELKQRADARRASQLAAADLALDPAEAPPSPRQAGAVSPPVAPRVASPVPRPIPDAAVPPAIAAAEAAVAEAMRATGTESPATAGADYARPAQASPSAGLAAPPPIARPAPSASAARPAPASPAPGAGPWRVQLGAFSVPGNAERLWARLGGMGVLAGKQRVLERAGRLTKLQAGGFASRAAAERACAALKAEGQACLPVR